MTDSLVLPPDGHLLDGDDDLQRVLVLCATAGRVDADLVTTCLGLDLFTAEDAVSELTGRGLVDHAEHGPRLARGVVRSVITAARGPELEDVQSHVLDLAVAGQLDTAVLLSLADTGCQDARLLELLVQREARRRGSQPEISSRLGPLARRLGWSSTRLALRRAEAALAADDTAACLSLCDGIMLSGDPEAARAAVELAALAESRQGNMGRALELHRVHGPTPGVAASAVVAAAAVGSIDEAETFAQACTAGTSSSGAWLPLVARGLLETLRGDDDEGIALLVRASVAAAPATQSPSTLPYSPASLAAGAALGHGDPLVATSILEQALRTEPAGSYAHQRHHLERAWVAMVTGDLDRCAQLLAESDVDPARTPRLALTGRIARLGLARRLSDGPGLSAAWAAVRSDLPGLHVDLFTLPYVGELVVAAARVGEPSRMEPHVERATRLVESIGRPTVWSTHLHWCGVQAAILGQQPEALRPHAAALGTAAGRSEHARHLAEAGQVWLRVLNRDVDVRTVRTVVHGLTRSGLAWDASRLAGLAAARTGDRDSSLELLQLARSVDQVKTVGEGDDRQAGVAGLTERELEVARLVAQGVGYRDIGDRLFISPRTVEHHVARIRRRLGTSTRREMLDRLRELLD